MNKPPVHAPDPYGWHHGCCRPDGEVDGERFIGTHGIISSSRQTQAQAEDPQVANPCVVGTYSLTEPVIPDFGFPLPAD